MSLFNRNSSSNGLFPAHDGDFGYGRIYQGNTGTVIEDAFTDTGAETADRPEYVGLAVNERQLRAFFAVIGLTLVIVVARAAHVQIASNERYVRLAEGNRVRTTWIPSERGVMYDRNGIPLVRNVPNFSVSVTPAFLPQDPAERAGVITRLSEILGLDTEEIEKKLAEFDDYRSVSVTIGDRLTHTQAVLARIEESRSPGVSLDTGTRREYLAGAAAPSLSHIIGFQGRITKEDLDAGMTPDRMPSDFIGKTGLERFYEETLRGVYGKRRIEVDATGREKKVIAETAGQAGRNIVLSIDLDLQKSVEAILADRLRKERKSRGSAVVMRPDTGEILAMVSLPAFDNNLFAKGISAEEFASLSSDGNNPLFPRAVSASLPSGSTFKLVVAAAALSENVITPKTTFLSTGGISVDKWFFPDWKAGGHGPTDVTKAIAESVNTFFYMVGGGKDDFQGLGVDRITAYARRFGLGAPLGLDLPDEGAGFLPSREWKETVKKERWYVGDTYHLAIGQGDILVTPLQIASMTSVFANGGTLVRPRLVNAVTSVSGDRTVREPEIIEASVVGEDAVNVVRRGMRQAVTAGSARSLLGLPVTVGAKTGTAQWHPAKLPHAWITAFAPYEKPEIVVTAVIEEGGEGSAAAAPVARAIIDDYFAKKH